LIGKGVFPYEWFDNYYTLEETALPPKDAFYSKLNVEDISDEDYEHAQKVSKQFQCETVRDYHNMYLICDTLHLADLFENFRVICQKHYELDPARYYTAPGLTWDACLKITGAKLNLLTDYDMLLMIDKGTRGGVSTISNRYAKANNHYMKNYNKDKKSIYMPHLYANNLQGYTTNW